MKYALALLLFSSCAHKDMNIKKAMQMCRQINGPLQDPPKHMPKDLALSQKSVITIINSCYKAHVERTRDPRDYVSCATVTYQSKHRPHLVIKSTEELLVPQIIIQCARTKFNQAKTWPKVKEPLKLEFVFHHIAVTKG